MGRVVLANWKELGARCASVTLAVLAVGALSVVSFGLAAGVGIPEVGAAIVAPTVETTAVTSVKPTSAVITGVVDPQGSPTTWYFEYGPNTTYVSITAVGDAGSGTAAVKVSRSLTGLAPATSYDYRIVARNSGGTTFGGRGTFNTTAAPIVVSAAATNVAVHAATLNGTVDPEALTTAWYFEYGLTTHYGSKTVTRYLAPSRNSTIVSVGISGLAAQNIYHYRIVAKSSAGTSVGADVTFTTGLSVTVNASTSAIVYGGGTTLVGSITDGATGVNVTVDAEQFNQSAFSVVGSVVTTVGGTWSYPVSPTVRTTYEAIANGATSSPVTVSVRPMVSLTEISRGRLLTQVVATDSFAGHVLQMQMLSGGLWVTWKHVQLDANGQAIFSTRLPRGVSMIRMAIAPFIPGIDQAAPGYLAGYSSAITHS